MKKVTSCLFLLFAVTFSSCTGQIKSQNSGNPETTNVSGQLVDELDPTIWSIYQDKNSNFWFGSKDNGVYFYNGKELRHYSENDGLVSNQVTGMQEDATGNIFIETRTGVSKFDSNSFTTLEIKNDDFSQNEWKLKPSDLWFRIGFNNKGPYRYDGEYLHYLKFPKSPREAEFYKKRGETSFSPYGLYSIYKDSRGNMWFGTTSIGLCRYDGEKISWHYEEQLQTTPGGGDFGTRSIIEDKAGLFWFNNSRYRYEILPGENGTDTLNHKKQAGIGYMNEAGEEEFPFFLSVAEDDDGDLWMVTYQDGVWRNNGKELINYPVMDGTAVVSLFKIYKDRQGGLWLGTHNDGVYKYNGESFEKFEF